MNTLQISSIAAGVFFGLWPLLLNKSGLSGNLSSVVYVGIVFLCVLPFVFLQQSTVTNANWWMAIGAGVAGAAGVLLFNGVLAKSTPLNVGTLFVLMLVVQTAVPAIYSLIVNGGISVTKALGFGFAAIAAVLLIKS